MSKKILYWVCQFTGWSMIIMTEFLSFLIEQGFFIELFLWSVIQIISCVILTHLYRHIVRKLKWVSLPLYRLIPRVIFSGLVLALLPAISTLDFDFFYILDDTVYLSRFLDAWISWSKTMFMWVLAYTVYHYVENLHTREMEQMLLKTSINDTEAKILRSQLNPHFMFNALNSIRALISEDPIKAQQSVTQLSNLLRNALLADRRKTVELREEIKTVEDYLALEKIRYEDRLTSDLHIDAQTQYLQIPPMMLQTLVENGIKHGVQKADQGGFVQISSFLENNYIHIHIRNTGVLGEKEASGGFGLKNTERRLHLLYGNDARFRIFQESETVVRAEIIVPIQTEGVFNAKKQSNN